MDGAPMSTLTPLPTLLSTRRIDGNRVHFTLTPDWQQGRTTFGGVISTLAVQAMRDVAGSQWPAGVDLRALQTSFIGPVTPGEVGVTVQVLREGKNVRQVQALVQQDGQTAALLLGVFGAARETAVAEMAPEQPPVQYGPDKAFAVPQIPGLTPAFLQHIDSRWGEGSPPYAGRDSWHSRIHLRLKGEDAHISTELMTVLLADVPPTPVLSRFTKPTPASSVSWELELRPLAQPHAAQGWWRVDTEVLAAANGYVNQVSRLWAPHGELAGLGYQVVAVYG
jgi:acyl-CoA thioesterase